MTWVESFRAEVKKQEKANLSLVHDRLFYGEATDENNKEMFRQAFVKKNALSRSCLTKDDQTRYGRCLRRRADLVAAIGGQSFSAETEWNFVTGTGIDNPTEVGLQWHPVYGVPFWPGSSVKGLLRAYALTLDFDASADLIAEVFGDGDRTVAEVFDWLEAEEGSNLPEPDDRTPNRASRAGRLIVFDALPVESVEIARDVMTPHYGEWYGAELTKKDGRDEVPANKAPGDWLNPVPIPFIVVPPKTRFHFAFALRGNAGRPESEILVRAKTWLEEALEVLGGGAKTAAGYGRFIGFREGG